MVKYFLTLLLLGSTMLMAQHSTKRFSDQPIRLNDQSLLLIPFESKMYLSDVDHDLALHNDINSKEIVRRFTKAIDQSILFTFQKRCTVNSFYDLEEATADANLAFIRDNTKLEYELVAKETKKNGYQKLQSKFKKKQDDSYQRGGIENGQIRSKRDNRERYMKAIVTNNLMLDSIHYIFDNDYFLFITELDLKNLYTQEMQMGRSEYQRELKLHYTIYQKDGEMLSTGISKTTFSSNLNDINKIIKTYFPILAEQIYADLFTEENSDY